MASSKTGKNGSRVSQRKHKEKGNNQRALTVDDFDLTHNVNGRQADPAEGREARLPAVIRGMRENKSIRQIAFEIGNITAVTIASDKKWVLEEAWILRQDLIWLWLEEQLQQYEHLLGLLTLELRMPLLVKVKEGKEWIWKPKLDEKGNPILVVNGPIMDRMLGIMDKVNELKGLKQAPIQLGLTIPGDNATVNVNKDAESAAELMDYLKSGKVGRGKSPPVS